MLLRARPDSHQNQRNLMTTHEQNILAARAVRKCRSGQSITNGEIDAALTVLPVLIHALSLMGDVYHLVKVDLHNKYYMLEGFKNERNKK